MHQVVKVLAGDEEEHVFKDLRDEVETKWRHDFVIERIGHSKEAASALTPSPIKALRPPVAGCVLVWQVARFAFEAYWPLFFALHTKDADKKPTQDDIESALRSCGDSELKDAVENQERFLEGLDDVIHNLRDDNAESNQNLSDQSDGSEGKDKKERKKSKNLQRKKAEVLKSASSKKAHAEGESSSSSSTASSDSSSEAGEVPAPEPKAKGKAKAKAKGVAAKAKVKGEAKKKSGPVPLDTSNVKPPRFLSQDVTNGWRFHGPTSAVEASYCLLRISIACSKSFTLVQRTVVRTMATQAVLLGALRDRRALRWLHLYRAERGGRHCDFRLHLRLLPKAMMLHPASESASSTSATCSSEARESLRQGAELSSPQQSWPGVELASNLSEERLAEEPTCYQAPWAAWSLRERCISCRRRFALSRPATRASVQVPVVKRKLVTSDIMMRSFAVAAAHGQSFASSSEEATKQGHLHQVDLNVSWRRLRPRHVQPVVPFLKRPWLAFMEPFSHA
eukprot:s2921_g7.t1